MDEKEAKESELVSDLLEKGSGLRERFQPLIEKFLNQEKVLNKLLTAHDQLEDAIKQYRIKIGEIVEESKSDSSEIEKVDFDSMLVLTPVNVLLYFFFSHFLSQKERKEKKLKIIPSTRFYLHPQGSLYLFFTLISFFFLPQ